ncbi:MAG: cytochrome c-type biogenesis protein CcmH [Gemmatimonadota bacterium]
MKSPDRASIRSALAVSLRVAGALLMLCIAHPEAAESQRQARPNAEEAERAIQQLRSPYCPGLMLEVCPSATAAALRDSIYDLAAEGATSEELMDWMLARHGEEWRGVPESSGRGLLAWLIPPLALLLGAGAVFGWLRANREDATLPGGEEVGGITDADRDRIAAALREWEASGGEEA